MEKSVEINGTAYPLKFGFGAYELLGEKWGYQGPQAVMGHFQEVFAEGKEPGFKQFKVLGDLAWAGMTNGGSKDVPEPNDIIDEIMFAPEKMEVIMEVFHKSIPQQKEGTPGNPQPAPKGRKKAPRKK